ncbi:hypothetical protein J7U46_15245 [Pelomonas sp. V22]|uniref:hypothetical protein n=1 Tax=Pelomonas sp. V22 TaxID=2822139 RepID=UPI0024A9968B|nr:hypothetical protein [Pelomonas sp. V22]MDI4634413.1 hypothetical protein [Pelomonas sp. V22]
MRFSGQDLAQALLSAVRAQDFAQTADAQLGGAPVQQHPSLDLAVAVFPAGGAPVFANVLFSREHPEGLVAEFGPGAGPVRNLHFQADQLDSQGRSVAWLPGADWQSLRWRTLAGRPGQPRVVAPYPASLVKLMVLVGVAHQVDQGHARWEQAWSWQGRSRPVRDWAFDMTVISSNDATSALVALLHAVGAIRREQGIEVRNEVHALFEAQGLHCLRLHNTRPDGGWRNADGAGVGQLQMTAWDTLRLLWLLDDAAPPAPWLPADTPPLLRAESRAVVLHCLGEQGLHSQLSSSLLAGLPGWVPGIPARLPARWIQPDGSALLDHDLAYPGDLRPAQARCDVSFAHKTGNTENYGADAGIVRGLGTSKRHYLIALTSNLGSRYAPHPLASSTWRIPALGAAIDAWLLARLGA